eukprot:3788939-Alexandrium_andersonii.AAC.1
MILQLAMRSSRFDLMCFWLGSHLKLGSKPRRERRIVLNGASARIAGIAVLPLRRSSRSVWSTRCGGEQRGVT